MVVQQHRPVYMKDWIERLDAILQLNGRELLSHAGHITHQVATEKVVLEYKKYRVAQKKISREISLKEIETDIEHLQGKACPLPTSHATEPLHTGQTKTQCAGQWLFHWQAPQRRYGPCARVPFGSVCVRTRTGRRAARRPSVALRSLAMEQPLRRRARLAYDHRATRCGVTCG